MPQVQDAATVTETIDAGGGIMVDIVDTVKANGKPAKAKSSSPKKSAPAKPAAKATAKPKAATADDKERAAAKAAGIGLVHYRVLQALVKAGKPMTYREIEAKTTYYSLLTKVCRDGYEGSLHALGLAKEEAKEVGGKVTLVFTATAKGRKVFGK